MIEEDWLYDGEGDAHPDDARLADALARLRYRAPEGASPTRRFEAMRQRALPSAPLRLRAARVAVIVAPLVVAAVVVLWLVKRPSVPHLAVMSLAGAPRVDARAIGTRGELGVGGWLETDGASRASVELAGVGRVDVAPDSRVGLVVTSTTEQRLTLARGRIDARVIAPPRLFVVDTPSAVATDLGCAYSLDVGDDGASTLRVSSGAVELAGDGRDAWVPASAACETRRGKGPGCPYYEDASDALKSALRRFDFEGDAGALGAVLDAARARDRLTLWHLQKRTDGEARARVLARLVELAGPAEGKAITDW